MRQVDCVTVKGSTKPVGLFTYDVDVEGMDSLRFSQHKSVGAVGLTAVALGCVLCCALLCSAVLGPSANQGRKWVQQQAWMWEGGSRHVPRMLCACCVQGAAWVIAFCQLCMLCADSSLGNRRLPAHPI